MKLAVYAGMKRLNFLFLFFISLQAVLNVNSRVSSKLEHCSLIEISETKLWGTI